MCAAANSTATRFGAPDTILTPPLGVPVPFPNFSFQATDIPVALNIFLCSGLPGTLGDQGTVSLGGVGIGGAASGTQLMRAQGILGSRKVFYSAMPAKRLGDPHITNSTNALAVIALVLQFKVWLFS